MTASYQLPDVCYCFPQGVLIPRSWELGWMKTGRRGLPTTAWRQACAENTRIYSHLRRTECIGDQHPAPSLRPLNWVGCPQQRQQNTMLTNKAGRHMHSSHTQAGSKPEAQVLCFMVPPLAAGHITIPYLL